MPNHVRPRLGHLVAMPLATIGILSAVLVLEIEHVGSLVLAFLLALIGLGVGAIVARAVRKQIDELAAHYEALLTTADDQSRRAEVANRMKDQFLATLSHELRTPLNSVLGWARLIESGKLDADHQMKAIQAIERAAWAQSRLIEDLLDTSRIGTGTLQISTRAVTVQPLVDAALLPLRAAAAAKQIALDVMVDPAIGAIQADPDRLQQILWHLVSNAIKFTPAHGRVVVSVAAGDGDLRLTVLDTGVGMSADVAAHLFERFRQGDSSSTREFGGLGLGLNIVRHLVELHGGTVRAESEGTNRGARFTVAIPMQDCATAAAATPAAIEAPPVLRGVTVLVVDDDPGTLDFVRCTLEQYGALVVTASSAHEARERFRREPPDVIVADLMMPDGDGFSLIREIREIDRISGRHTPAAALTARARKEDRRSALDAGFELHMAKPIDALELASTVERLVHHPSDPAEVRPQPRRNIETPAPQGISRI